MFLPQVVRSSAFAVLLNQKNGQFFSSFTTNPSQKTSDPTRAHNNVRKISQESTYNP